MALPLKVFKGGIKPPHNKGTENIETIEMPLPKKVIIPMQQHIGAPLTPLVKKGDTVKLGQKIGDSTAYVSSPVHASVSGKVTAVQPIISVSGAEVMAVEIEPDGLQELHESVVPPVLDDQESIFNAIRESGIVGLGGAGFPTAVKLKAPAGKKFDVLVINGAECEPYITSDYREMIENTENVLEGIKLVMDIAGVEKALIGIEDNKPEAIKKLSEGAKKYDNIEVVKLRSRYPQGGEKQLIYAVTGRIVPSGGLPADVGVVVQNVNTVSFLASYFKTGMPLIKKRITVAGSAIAKAANVLVPIGTQLSDIIEFCGGLKEKPGKVIMGGPMMGIAQYTLDTPLLKQNNAILVLSVEDSQTPEESACIRCGRCVQACPMNLMPLYINACMEAGKVEDTLKYHVNDCIECGCCSYICPASRKLVQSIRYAKSELRRIAAAKKSV
jgi:electron transport complex protein RnfC